MNEIAKNAASDRFLKALEKESLNKNEGGTCLGLTAPQVSCLFNPKYWNRLGNAGWDKILAWVNSGQRLKEYSEKHGKTVAEKPNQITSKAIKANEVAKDEIEMLRKNLGNYKPEAPERAKDEPEVKAEADDIEPRPMVGLAFYEEQMGKANDEIRGLIKTNDDLRIKLGEYNKPDIIRGEPLTAPSFMESFIEALKQIPSNVTIQISINESK